MRAILSVLIAVVTAGPGASELLAQTDRAPVFRSGVEVMEVDVTVVDAKGMPVRDLRAPEFTVTVDGQPRRVISAEFVAESGESAADAAKPRDPYVSNNTDRRPGRLIMLVVDRNNIDTHTIRGAVAALKRFVAGVSPDDRSGARDHTASRAVCRFHDQPRADPQCDSRASWARGPDVLAVQHQRLRGDHLRESIEPDRHAAAAVSCVRRHGSQHDVALRSRCRAGGVDEGDAPPPAHVAVRLWICRAAEEPARRRGPEVDDHPLAGLDARGGAGRVVSPCDARGRGAGQHQRDDVRSGGGKCISIPHLGDASRRIAICAKRGLETLAGRSRGSLFRVVTNPEFVFERLRHEISAHYMLGVEPAERDRDGKPHQIQVKVGRQNVQVRARRQVQYTRLTPNSWSRDVVMGRVLRSPAANTELPMRLSTYTFRDTAPNKVKLILAAEIDPESMEKELDLAIGFAVFDDMGKVVLSGQERKIYSANTDLPIRYELAVPVDPGQYRLRLAAVDMSGKSGSVEREVPVFGMANQEFAIGDLILSSVREGRGNDLRAPVVLRSRTASSPPTPSCTRTSPARSTTPR